MKKKIFSKIIAVVGIMTVLISVMVIPSAAWTVNNDGSLTTNRFSIYIPLEYCECEPEDDNGDTLWHVDYSRSDLTMRLLLNGEQRASCLVFSFGDSKWYGHIMSTRYGYVYEISAGSGTDKKIFQLTCGDSFDDTVDIFYSYSFYGYEFDILDSVQMTVEVFPSYSQYRSALQALVEDGTITTEQAQAEIDSLNAKIQTMSSQMNDLRLENGVLESEIGDLRDENNRLQIEAEDYYQNCNNTLDKVSELEHQNASMSERLEQLLEEAGTYPELVASLRKQITEMENANVLDELFTGIFGGIWEGLYTVWNLGYYVGDTYVSIGGLLIVVVVGIVALFVIKLVRGG